LVSGAGGIPESIKMAPAYTAWASRYMHEYGVGKEAFGRFAVNMRTNAAQNPFTAMRAPMTLDDYYAARMIRWPLSMLDMDIPVDGADAFVLTTAERAKSLRTRRCCSASIGLGTGDEDQLPSPRSRPAWSSARSRRRRPVAR
jgi:acetyl-CoA acetyltransferase